MTAQSDVLIIGSGPVGATLALALQQQDIRVTLLEAREPGAAYQDKRALALSHGSRLILERLGVWQALQDKATAIETIHISQRGSLGRSRLKAAEHDLPALGYVLAYGDLSAALDNALNGAASAPEALYGAEATGITPATSWAEVTYQLKQQSHTRQAKLVVLADGGRSLGEIAGIRRESRHYGHDALVSKVSAELPHGNVAYERFTPEGPMALLPNGERDFSLVWTGEQHGIAELLALDDETFLQRLHQHFGDRVGRFTSVARRLSFPLKLSYLDPVTAPHLVVIGNAAQTMHPVAGQGFNVGLRDAWELAQQILATPSARLGDAAMLKQYQQGRRTDSKRGLVFTDMLVNLFASDLLGLPALRGVGLGLLDVVAPAKQKLVSKMSYGSHG